MTELLASAGQRAERYLQSLDNRRVAPGAQALDRLGAFDEPLPDAPTDSAAVLAMLDEIGSPATIASAGGRYFGLVVGGALPAALAANWLASAWDQNGALVTLSPINAALETVTLRWLLDILGLPASAAGAFVSGGTMANLTCLAAARHAVLTKVGWNIEGDGLIGAPPVTVVTGAEEHPTVLKALGILGLGRTRVVVVPSDAEGRMRADALPSLDGPAIVCAQVGNVNTGSCDPLAEICAWAHETGAWVHVDGAFGLWAAAAPDRAYLVRGMAEADSWATDAHKWLNVPYDSGLAFVRDADALRAAMSVTGAYLPQGETREPSQYTPELSRRARAVDIWAALRSLGRTGVGDMIERTCRHATRFAEGLRAAGFEILNDVVLNQVLVSFGDAERNRQVIAAIQADGTCWCGGTVWQGREAMRISVSSWATTEADVDRSLAAMLRIADGER